MINQFHRLMANPPASPLGTIWRTACMNWSVVIRQTPRPAYVVLKGSRFITVFPTLNLAHQYIAAQGARLIVEPVIKYEPVKLGSEGNAYVAYLDGNLVLTKASKVKRWGSIETALETFK